VRVSLQGNAYGGVTVVVLLPQALIVALAEAPVVPVVVARPGAPVDGFAWLAPRPATGEVEPARPVVERPVRDARPAGSRGLPRRVRQASIVAQLRTDAPGSPVPGNGSPVAGEDETAVRTPEQMRAMMSSFQLGTNRGRARPGRPDDGGVA
jgi:hypothetical protein